MAYPRARNREGGGSCIGLNNGGGDMMKPSSTPVQTAVSKTIASVGDKATSTIDGKSEK